MEKQIFLYISTRDNKLRQFSFRLLHRIIVTKKELFKFRVTDDATCIFCPNSDTIEHTFLDCPEIKTFYSEALVWFNCVNNTELFSLTSKLLLMKYPTFINYPNTQDADYTYLSFFWNNMSTAVSALRKNQSRKNSKHGMQCWCNGK